MIKLAYSVSLLLCSIGAAEARKQTQQQNRFLQTTPASAEIPTIDPTTGGFDQKTHSPKLPCFSCIMADYIFCQNAPDHAHVELGQQMPQGVCCESKTNCPQLTLPGWTCSDSYSDKLLSLRMCPFDHSRCGNQSEIVLFAPGMNMNQNLTFYPGDVCFFTMRTECGIPSFNPQGLETATGVDIYTIEYDDQDVDSEVVNVNETTTTIPDPQSNTTMKPKIPLPKKKENFDGQPKNISQSDAYLLRYQVNPDGTTTYFYSNGSSFSYETTTTITYNDPTDTKSYEVQYRNGTNITVNKDGGKVVKVPGQADQNIAAPAPPAPAAAQTESYNYEDSLGGRRLQTTTNTTAGKPWGTVVFFYDGRVRELLADGKVKDDWQYYINAANATSNKTLNSSFFLKIRVNTNGSYIEYWSNGIVNDYSSLTNWNKYYFVKKPEYARQIINRILNTDGSIQLTFLNTTNRYYYPPLTRQNTTFQNQTAIKYEDIYYDQSKQTTNVTKFYFNGTVALFVNQEFSSFIVAPTQYAKDWKRVNFTDGSYVIYYETQQRKVFYPPPPIPGVDSPYTIATSILSTEDTTQGITRVVFRNGTIINKNNIDGTFKYEVQPTTTFPASETKYMNNCQYQVFDYVNDTNTIYYCPPDQYSKALFNATGPKTNTTLRDGSRRVEYLNGTIARFNNNNTFNSFEVPPKSIYFEFNRILRTDGSSFIDYSPVNGTRRDFPPPLPASATPMMIACAVRYTDVFLSNGSSRVFYTNNTVALFQNNVFKSYIVPPRWMFGACVPGQYFDGRPMLNCTDINQTIIVFNPPLGPKNTLYENATAAARDVYFANLTFIRHFYNGSVGVYQDTASGQISFVSWRVPPLTMFTPPTDYRFMYYSDGSKVFQYTNGTSLVYAPDLNMYSTLTQNATSQLFRVKDPVAGQTRIHFRNGSVLFEWFNGTNEWSVPPKSYFVPFYSTINDDGKNSTFWDDGRYIYDYLSAPQNATEFEKATAPRKEQGFPNKTAIISYFNGTVAEFRDGSFYAFIIPPKSYFIQIDIRMNSDGSKEKFFSNGTYQWFAPPPSKNESAEQFAFRIAFSDYTNGTKTLTYANGTVVSYLSNGTMIVNVQPKTLFITRQAFLQANGSLIEQFSNGTTRFTAALVDDRLDDLERSRFVVIEETYSVDKKRRVYLNGTVALFFKGNFSGYEVKPSSFYNGCVKNKTASGHVIEKCWNDTIRVFNPPMPETASEEEFAIGVKSSEYTIGENTTTYFYLNGTIALIDRRNGSFISYKKKPESLYVPYQNQTDSQGNKEIIYGDGRKTILYKPPTADATLYDNATSPAWKKIYANGTFETKFNNGTHIRVEVVGNVQNMTYIKKVEGSAVMKDGDKVIVKMQNNSTRTYFPPPPATATEFEEMTAPNYTDVFDNGTSFIKYSNGSLANIFNGTFIRWIIKPEYYLEDINRTDYQDGSYQIQFLKNKTVRYYLAPISDTASEKDRALAMIYIEKFINGTVKRAFLNGTIAVYYNNVLVKYDVKPKKFFKESNIDQPLEEEEADGSKKIFFSNGTVRYFQSTSIISDKLYMDCYTNLTCVSFYQNGTKIRYDDGVFVSSEEPPKPEARDPNYKYVDKTGPKIQAYDKSQGGIKKYKEEYQNNDARAQKSEPQEPICKGRNQMIIMGDKRIKKAVYNSTRILQTESSDEGPAVLALKLESVGFAKDTISSFASGKLVSIIVTILSLSLIIM